MYFHRGCWYVLSPTRRETNYSDLTRDSFNILPPTSKNLLNPFSNICKKKKKNYNFVRPTWSPRQQWPTRQKKNGDLSIVFSVQGKGSRPTGPDPENRMVMKTLVTQMRQFLLGSKYPVRRGIFIQEQNHHSEFPAALFFQNVLQLHQQRWVILRVDGLPIWKIVNDENTLLITKNQGKYNSNNDRTDKSPVYPSNQFFIAHLGM
jgi:hypothetical protein